MSYNIQRSTNLCSSTVFVPLLRRPTLAPHARKQDARPNMGAEMSACCEPTPQGAFAHKPDGVQPQVYRGMARDSGYSNVTREGQTYASNYQHSSDATYRTQSPLAMKRDPVTNWGDRGVPASFDAHRSPPQGGTFDASGAYESQRRGDSGNYSTQVCVRANCMQSGAAAPSATAAECLQTWPAPDCVFGLRVLLRYFNGNGMKCVLRSRLPLPAPVQASARQSTRDSILASLDSKFESTVFDVSSRPAMTQRPSYISSQTPYSEVGQSLERWCTPAL